MPNYCGKAIVISSIPYSESSLICKLYTEEFGLKSYIVRSAKKKDSKTPTQHFQSLNIIEFEAYNNNKTKLESIRTSSLISENLSINFSIVKNSLTFFIAEVINLSLKEHSPNEELFKFLYAQIIKLKKSNDEDLAEFHLNFMLQFADLLGLSPMNNYSNECIFFNPVAGKFTSNCDIQSFNLEQSLMLHKLLLNCNCSNERICNNKIQRNLLLDGLIVFYTIHITNHQPIKSHKILSTILS